jgi:hypothetical protein
MNATFQFSGSEYSLYTNGKIYNNGIQYVEVKSGYQRSSGQWDHNAGSWKKQLGNPWFNEAVAKAAGFIKEAHKVEKKPRTKKALSPALASLQLREGKKARLVRGKLVIKEASIKVEKDQEEAKWAMMRGIQIRQDARAFERKRNLSDQEVLDRVPREQKERYIAAKALLDQGVYRPK